MPIIPESIVEIKQQRLSNGHASILPIVITVPAGEARYTDFIVPAYTNGLDWSTSHFNANDSDSGDEIVTGKLLAGRVGALAVEAASEATTITVVSEKDKLHKTSDGGNLDEGFYLSFGTEASTAEAINNGPPSGCNINPDQELKEYEIKRIVSHTDIGGGYESTVIELFTPLSATVAANTNVNLVVRAIKWKLPLVKGDQIDIGSGYLMSGNLPAGMKIRFGYKDSRVSGADKIVRAYMHISY